MSREIKVGAKVQDIAAGVSYKTIFEAPHDLPVCCGRLLLSKERGVINKEKWYLHIHQDKNGNIKTNPICLTGEQDEI
jgi:hypothetical protein